MCSAVLWRAALCSAGRAVVGVQGLLYGRGGRGLWWPSAALVCGRRASRSRPAHAAANHYAITAANLYCMPQPGALHTPLLQARAFYSFQLFKQVGVGTLAAASGLVLGCAAAATRAAGLGTHAHTVQWAQCPQRLCAASACTLIGDTRCVRKAQTAVPLEYTCKPLLPVFRTYTPRWCPLWWRRCLAVMSRLCAPSLPPVSRRWLIRRGWAGRGTAAAVG